MLNQVNESLSMDFLDRLAGSELEISADLQQVLLGKFGPRGRYPGELVPVLRQAALGSAQAVEDLLALPGTAPLVAYLQSPAGQANRIAAEAALDAAIPPPEPAQPMREKTIPPLVVTLTEDAVPAPTEAVGPAQDVTDVPVEAPQPAEASPPSAVRSILGELYDGLALLLTGATPAEAEAAEPVAGSAEKPSPLESAVPVAAAPSIRVERPCWTPILNRKRPPGLLESRYGGDTAWVAAKEAWPLHDDGGPMSLVLQFDMSALPGDIATRLGGVPGQLFQLFIPFGGLRGLVGSHSPFVVRMPNLSEEGRIEQQPSWDGLQGGVPTLPAVTVEGWLGQPDWPFDHGGPYLPDVEAALVTLPEGADNIWGDKLGGWPSLEQGPILPEAWDHIIQITGGGVTGAEVAFDGHAWLVRDPEGQLHWVTVSS